MPIVPPAVARGLGDGLLPFTDLSQYPSPYYLRNLASNSNSQQPGPPAVHTLGTIRNTPGETPSTPPSAVIPTITVISNVTNNTNTANTTTSNPLGTTPTTQNINAGNSDDTPATTTDDNNASQNSSKCNSNLEFITSAYYKSSLKASNHHSAVALCLRTVILLSHLPRVRIMVTPTRSLSSLLLLQLLTSY